MNYKTSALLITLFTSFCAKAQQQQLSISQLAGQQNVLTTTVPFLTISPDARAAGMGDAGVATTPDANSGHWNPAKFAFIEKPGGMSISYTPWLRQLVSDVSFSYLSAYGRINKRSVVSGSMKYFSLGNINFTDISGRSLGSFNPYELALDGNYAVQLSNHFSLGVSLRYIYSNLVGPVSPQGVDARPGVSGAGDVSAYYQNKKRLKDKKMLYYAFGGNISNIGNKMTYTSNVDRAFIPVNLRLGTSVKYEIDEHNTISFALDLNKLLVPTPPVYLQKAGGGDSILNGKKIVAAGKDNNVPLIQGMLQSFGDAPGGFREELNEIIYSFGVEYWYEKQFAVRGGYFHENEKKGNRKYFTFGVGVRYKVFGLDVAYLAPIQQRNPLQNTLRFSLLFDFAAFRSQQNETPPTK